MGACTPLWLNMAIIGLNIFKLVFYSYTNSTFICWSWPPFEQTLQYHLPDLQKGSSVQAMLVDILDGYCWYFFLPKHCLRLVAGTHNLEICKVLHNIYNFNKICINPTVLSYSKPFRIKHLCGHIVSFKFLLVVNS